MNTKSKSGCEIVGCKLFVSGVCTSDTFTCICRTDEDRVDELECIANGLTKQRDDLIYNSKELINGLVKKYSRQEIQFRIDMLGLAIKNAEESK